MIFTNAEHDADSIQENEKRIYHIKKEDKVVGQNLHLKYDSKYHLTETSRQHKKCTYVISHYRKNEMTTANEPFFFFQES